MGTNSRIGKQYGRFRVQQRIGGGAMGEVYRAWDTKRGRDVALKLLARDLQRDSEFVERFEREALVLSAMQHPNVVFVHDWGTANGEFYIAMEFVDGSNLDEALFFRSEQKERTPYFRPLPTELALALARDACLGLEHLHEKDVIHRDLKPANILLSRNGMVLLTDFGLARRVDDSVLLTSLNRQPGSPAYMSPEQVGGVRDIDSQSDVFSMGVVTYELFAGSRPFRGLTVAAVMQQIQSHNQESVGSINPLVPPEVDAVLQRMLVKDRTRRCESVREARVVLDKALANAGVHSTRDLLQEFYAEPRATVQRLCRNKLETEYQRGLFFERQGTEGIQSAVDAMSHVLLIDPAHDEARKHFDRLVHESAGGTRPLPLNVPEIPRRPGDGAGVETVPLGERGPGEEDGARRVSESGVEIDPRLGSGPLSEEREFESIPVPFWRRRAAIIAAAVIAVGVVGLAFFKSKTGGQRSPESPSVATAGSDTAAPPVTEVPTGPAIEPPVPDPRRLKLSIGLDPQVSAELRLDGVTAAADAQGRAEFDALTPGNHTLRVRAEGFRVWQHNVKLEVDRDSVLLIALKPIPAPPPPAPPKAAQLVVHSTTLGLVVWVDDQRRGGQGQPFEVEPSEAPRRIAYRADGYLDQTEQHVFAAGERFERDVTLQPKPTEYGYILVTLEGSEGTDSGEIWIDGVDTGKSAPGRVVVAAGVHQVQVKKPGFVMFGPGGDAGQSVDVPARAEKKLPFKLVQSN